MKSDLPISEKRERIQQIKSNCIQCKRSVGTIFSFKNKHYKAVCGSKESPCKLNIDLIAGNVVNIPDTIQVINEIYQDEIVNIMKTKLDLLFNFKTEEETLQKFEELNVSLKSNNKILKHYRDLENQMKQNTEKQEEIDNINSSIEVLIDEFKKNIETYKRDKKIVVLKDTMTLFIDKLMPLLMEKRRTENVYQAIEFNEIDDKFYLIQHKYLSNKLEDVIQPSSIVTNNS